MPNSFSKIYIHHISAVKYRSALILPGFEKRLHQYIAGIIKDLGQTTIAINGMEDHIHIAARIRPSMSSAEFVKIVKGNSSKWINENKLSRNKFSWQTGGATFSVSETHVERLKIYIDNQKVHHKEYSFKEEYFELLAKNNIKVESPSYLPEFFGNLR